MPGLPPGYAWPCLRICHCSRYATAWPCPKPVAVTGLSAAPTCLANVGHAWPWPERPDGSGRTPKTGRSKWKRAFAQVLSSGGQGSAPDTLRRSGDLRTQSGSAGRGVNRGPSKWKRAFAQVLSSQGQGSPEDLVPTSAQMANVSAVAPSPVRSGSPPLRPERPVSWRLGTAALLLLTHSNPCTLGANRKGPPGNRRPLTETT
jgi:hypothetical protein